VPEWSNGAVSKTAVAFLVTEGSNPSLSAFYWGNIFRFGIFCFGMYISIEMTKRKKSIYADDYREIILKLITFRKKAGLTQNDVAILLSSSQSYISKIENCQIRIDLIQLKQFANIYQIKIQNLIE
jgi:hypothetical protein